MTLIIRPERKEDHRTVEELTRQAFWNLHVPGADEHYLVHILRSADAFIPELNFVAIKDHQIVGNIMYTQSWVECIEGNRYQTITFGPLSVRPEYQGQGIGSALIEYSRKQALTLGYTAIIIFGYPHYYCRHGFKSTKDFQISDAEGHYPFAQLVLPLCESALNSIQGKFHISDVFTIDPEKAEQFDQTFPFLEKKFQVSQSIFSIACRSFIH